VPRETSRVLLSDGGQLRHTAAVKKNLCGQNKTKGAVKQKPLRSKKTLRAKKIFCGQKKVFEVKQKRFAFEVEKNILEVEKTGSPF